MSEKYFLVFAPVNMGTSYTSTCGIVVSEPLWLPSTFEACHSQRVSVYMILVNYLPDRKTKHSSLIASHMQQKRKYNRRSFNSVCIMTCLDSSPQNDNMIDAFA